MISGKTLRLGRILDPSKNRAVIIALDHEGYAGPMPGLIDPLKVLEVAVKGGADAVIVTPGTLSKGCKIIAGKLGVVLRIDGGQTSLHPNPAPRSVLTYTVNGAIRLGADAVIMMAYIGTKYETESLKALGYVASECEECGMPLIAETFPTGEFCGKERLAEFVKLSARVGSAMGADTIKTFYTGSVESFKEVVSGCLTPVVVAGGPRMKTEKDALEVARDAVEAGANGVAFGRNVWQSRNPLGMVKALVEIVHKDKAVNTALAHIKS
ncbi:MAG: 2-amino-3,7-dideoxy-D-threo-hept-6-ulosonate synthase [Candidatus Bathyarchaeia archaeon]|jgi:fructose-bisphosphate aldolase/2-amino-3,7-dideoxy-D-threo-hept-6-ulosonate synthase